MTTYTIHATDNFVPSDYPLINDELRMLKEMLSLQHSPNKSEMAISFLRYHSLRSTWLIQSPGVVRVLTSKATQLANMEALFDSCKGNPGFIHALELFIEGQLS